MQTLTDIVAAVVVHSSAVAYSHFGVTFDTQQVKEPTPVERTVARTSATPKQPGKASGRTIVKAVKAPVADRAEDCPDQPSMVVKA